MMRIHFRMLSIIAILMGGFLALPTIADSQMLGDPVDVSQDFQKMEPVYFIGGRVVDFNPATGNGALQWNRYVRNTTLSFNKIDVGFQRARSTEFPATEYDQDPTLPFSVTFVSPRTIRLRFNTRATPIRDEASLMLNGPVHMDSSWKIERRDRVISYTSAFGRVRIIEEPWHIEFYDPAGHLLTRTQNIGDPATFFAPIPFSFLRRSSDLSHRVAATFQLQYDEKIFGCGESFTRLNKRGQKIVLSTRDGMGTQSEYMYKPIPFFLSSNGYGMFVHTSAPVTFDFGKSYDAHNVIYSGDENLDIFVFLGTPKEILSEYTALTGRSPVPPLWSFGFWMSRVTYKSEEEVREVATNLRKYRVPADVIHLDTGWFETEWRGDYQFSASRFRDPAKMIAELKQQGFHVSLWQYPYFTSKNELSKEMIEEGYEVKNDSGVAPFEDAVLDMSNPAAVRWYQAKLANLLKMGVGAIKVDFGEGAPFTGQYASGRTGWYEHGFPMVRALFFEYPNDPTSWLVDDEYMFGSNLLVAPIFETADARKVYLPPGKWIDYQTGKVYPGAQWQLMRLDASEIPVMLLVRDHTVLPHLKVALSTSQMDWDNVELRVFSTDSSAASGIFSLPGGDLLNLRLDPIASGFALTTDPLAGICRVQ